MDGDPDEWLPRTTNEDGEEIPYYADPDYFTCKFFHGGCLNLDEKSCVGGKICYFDNVDKDRVSLTEVDGMVRGIDRKYLATRIDYYYNIGSEAGWYRKLNCDADVVEMASYVPTVKLVNIYLVHKEMDQELEGEVVEVDPYKPLRSSAEMWYVDSEEKMEGGDGHVDNMGEYEDEVRDGDDEYDPTLEDEEFQEEYGMDDEDMFDWFTEEDGAELGFEGFETPKDGDLLRLCGVEIRGDEEDMGDDIVDDEDMCNAENSDEEVLGDGPEFECTEFNPKTDMKDPQYECGTNVKSCHKHLPPMTKPPSKKRKLNGGEEQATTSATKKKKAGPKDPPKTKNELRRLAALKRIDAKEKRDAKKAKSNSVPRRVGRPPKAPSSTVRPVTSKVASISSCNSSVQTRNNGKKNGK